MKKIKKFKISLRLREVARLLKNTTRITEITPEIEQIVQRECLRIQGIVTPAAIYDTHPKEKIPQELFLDPPEKWVAASMYLVTIGADVEAEIQAAKEREDETLLQILHTISLEALDESYSFINRLIAEEAKDETCELAKHQRIQTPEAWARLLEFLPADKVGVQLGADNAVQPQYSTGGIIYWVPYKKRKN